MQRRLRSRKLRRWLLDQFDGKCAICGVPLDNDWHADHIIPWSVSARTNVYEMQPLCPKCNLKKGARMTRKYRPGQRKAINFAVERLRQWAESHPLDRYRDNLVSMAASLVLILQLPTRYGKSDVARSIAALCVEYGLFDYFIVLSPGRRLKDQMGSAEKWHDAVSAYGIADIGCMSLHDAPRTSVKVSARFLSVTLQAFHSQLEHWKHWIDYQHARGKRVAIMPDEAHGIGDSKAFGVTMAAVMDKCPIIYMTATPVRHDGLPLPGCSDKYKATSERQFKRTVVRPGKDDETVIVDVYDVTAEDRELTPDLQVTFADAWTEDPLPMCKVSVQRVDADVSDVDSGWSGKLSDAPKNIRRKALKRAVRSREFIAEAIAEGVKRRQALLQWYSRVQMAVFCDNRDANSADDAHVEAVVNELRLADPSLAVVVANQDDDDSAATLDRFADGAGDVVVLKQMGGTGYDAPGIKVVIDLSTVRTYNSCVQRWMRGATIFDRGKVCVLILPADIDADAIWQELTDGEKYGCTTITSEKLIDSHEKDRKNSPDAGSLVLISGADVSESIDSDQTKLSVHEVEYVDSVIDSFSLQRWMIGNGYTKERVFRLIESGEMKLPGMSPPPRESASENRQFQDPRSEIDAILKRCEGLKQAIAARMGRRGDKATYSDIDRQARSSAGIPLGKGIMKQGSFTDLPAAQRYEESLKATLRSFKIANGG